MIVENINQLSFKNKKSYDDMGLIITEAPTLSSPERDVSYTSVPGRNGDIIQDNGRYKNIDVSYRVTAIVEEFNLPLMAKKIKAWLQREVGYFPLSDTYEPNYYRMASFTGKIDIEEKLRLLGSTTIKFNCKPFKYSIDGKREIKLTAAATIYNREDWESTPYIKIVGSGNITLSINNSSFAFTGVDGYIEVDGDLQASFKGTELQNEKISFSEFPKLSTNENNISWIGAVNEVIIVPRWCCL